MPARGDNDLVDWIGGTICIAAVFLPLLVWFVAGEFAIKRWRRELMQAGRAYAPVPAGKSIELTFAGNRARLQAAYPRYTATPSTTFTIALPITGWLRVRQRNAVDRFFELFAHPRATGRGAAFDREYVVKASDDAVAGRILGPIAADVLVKLAHVKPRLDARPGVVTLHFNEFIRRDAETFRNLFDCVNALVEDVADPSGVEVGDVTIRTGLCPTCGVEVAGGGRACEACGAVQHADCWAYLGGCATFACGGRRSKPARP